MVALYAILCDLNISVEWLRLYVFTCHTTGMFPSTIHTDIQNVHEKASGQCEKLFVAL